MMAGVSEDFVETARRRFSAVVLLAILAGVAVMTVALYQKAFTDVSTVTVKADRAGLQMRAGTVVKYKGVDVGKVEAAKPSPDGRTAVITMGMYPDMLGKIPKDVDVSLEQLTAFGNKGVVLRPVDGSNETVTASADTLQAGDVLTADHIAVEANQIFDHLDSVLTTLEPVKVNSVLTALAETVEGKGDRLGESLETADRYLKKINTDLPTLQRDLDKGADTLDIYSDASSDLLATLDSLTTTARTVSSNQSELSSLLDSVTAVGKEGVKFADANTDRLDQLVATLLPTTSLLKEYSPEIACTLKMASEGNDRASKAFGTSVPGLLANVALIAQGARPYRNPSDLPVMGMSFGPNCWGYPLNKGQKVAAGILDPYDVGLSPETSKALEPELSLNNQPLSGFILGDLAQFIPGLETPK